VSTTKINVKFLVNIKQYSVKLSDFFYKKGSTTQYRTMIVAYFMLIDVFITHICQYR